jgi:hypothetical protein
MIQQLVKVQNSARKYRLPDERSKMRDERFNTARQLAIHAV